MSDSPLKKQFRILLVKIGSGLSAKNSRQLRFIHNPQVHCGTPPGQDTDGLDVLEELMIRGEFDAYDPEKLQDILESIGRKDFSDAIKEYKKSSIFKSEKKEKKKRKEVFHPVDEGLILPLQLPTAAHSTPSMDKFDPIVLQLTKTMDSVIESIEAFVSDDSKKLAHTRITHMKAEMATLKKLIQETKKEKVSTRDHKSKEISRKGVMKQIKQVEDSQDRDRSNSLDSKLGHPKFSKVLPDIQSHVWFHKPVPALAIVCSELHQKLRQQNAAANGSDSGSTTSSGSSIASQEGNTTTQERYVPIPVKRDGEQDLGKRPAPEGSCPNGGQVTQDDPVYDDPDRKPEARLYVNFPILSTEDKRDPPHGYANVPPRPAAELKH